MEPNPINRPLGRVAIGKHSTRLRLYLSLIIGVLLLAACSRSVSHPPDTPPTDPITPQWSNQDIGQVSLPGKVYFFSDQHAEVHGSGSNIWGSADSFHFAYQPLHGDGTITAQVLSINGTEEWAKAGVMIREQLIPESRNALVSLTPLGIVEFNRRLEIGGLTSNNRRPIEGSSRWVRLVRQGDIFSAYESADGAAWHLVARDTIIMASQVYVGLAVTSHNPDQLAQGELEQVVVMTSPTWPSTPAINSVTINEANQSIVVGGTFNFTATVDAVGGADPVVTWSSSDETVATVDTNGVVTGVAVGTATITATSVFDSTKAASVVVTVSATSSPPPSQASYYISPTGSDSNDGRTPSTPFRTIQRAAAAVRPGDLVYLRGGSYYSTPYIDLATSGTPDRPIVWESYPGERAIINGRDAPNGGRGAGFVRIYGSHQVFRNLDITNTPQHGFLIIDANHIVFDGVRGYFNRGTPINGFRTSNSLFINNVLCDNADPQNSYDDADGLTIAFGDNNIVRYNIFCRNSDDGLDIWRSTNTLVEYNIAYSNGYNSVGDIYHNRLVNGFKLGVYNLSDGGGHTVRFNLAYNNTGFGFMDNAPASGFIPITFYNNTAWNNAQIVNWARDISFLSAIPHVVRNNLAVLGPNSLASSAFQLSSTIIRSHNSWDLGITNPNFISLDTSSAFFLALAQNSPAIDVGIGMGVPYTGAEPDLGALEFGRTIADLLGPSMLLASSSELYAYRQP
ncbi:MAG: Ig-like domain-containing protein [Truepera sp.]|nr:Ig-like domain-containing protein [Truepera sp.]